MALVYQLRAYDPGGITFVYWNAPVYDTGGIYWLGPPSFGTLIDVILIRTYDDGIISESMGLMSAKMDLDNVLVPSENANLDGLINNPSAKLDLGAPVTP